MNETNLSLKYLIDQLHKEQTLTKEEWITLIEGHTPELSEYLFSLAREERHRYYGHDVYVRGLIEFTNYCKNDCYYCGIRRSNPNAKRYDEVSIQEVIDKQLAVVDLTASILSMENKMPMYVFGLNEENSIVKAISGDFNGTKVTV